MKTNESFQIIVEYWSFSDHWIILEPKNYELSVIEMLNMILK
jgi:hypothetical protein